MAIVKVTYDYIKRLLASQVGNYHWRRVRNLICVHTYLGEYYINICKFKDSDGQNAMSMNVDNSKYNIRDIVSVEFPEGTDEYKYLLAMYKNAIENCIQVQVS